MRSDVNPKLPLKFLVLLLFIFLASLHALADTPCNLKTIEQIRHASPLFGAELSQQDLREALTHPISANACNASASSKTKFNRWHQIRTQSKEIQLSTCPPNTVIHLRSYLSNDGGQLWVVARESGVTGQTWRYNFYSIANNQPIIEKSANDLGLNPPTDNAFLSYQDKKFSSSEDTESPIYLLKDGTFIAQPNPYSDPKWQSKHIERNFLYQWNGSLFVRSQTTPFV
ncbi:MAG TPA: hypothetical protein VFX23_03595 [Limnobacter sp.]|uniref:hypothetical protein n=1 Tax=Limnobacter sp. TaxID=2003368 RepID=UPI002E36F893|nr:hypothetical protein [Limnobacter sp.]HEX5485060.1 hypothetical protein [Limnobacter sp.]